MIPLTDSVKLGFRAVLNNRKFAAPQEFQKDFVDRDELDPHELFFIKDIIARNTPLYCISDQELRTLFRSYQHKRTYKKVRIKYEQMALL